MEITQLPNYGKGYAEMIADPALAGRLQKAMMIPMLTTLFRELGLIGLIQTMQQTSQATDKMLARDWSRLEKPGCNCQPLIKMIVQNTASMQVMADRVGLEKAQRIMKQLVDITAEKQLAILFAPPEALATFPDPFASFMAYLKAMYAAMVREGTHHAEFKEDTDKVFAFDVTYCIWHEIAKEFSEPALGYPSCYGDEVGFPKMGERLGFRFTRNSTLILGAPACDFRFERI